MKAKFRFTLLLAICASFLLVPAAQATPIIWYLSNVTFTGGGMASGSFTYDASTNTYSAINISTTGGSLPATTYTADSIGLASGLALTEGLNRNWLLAFSSPLTNGGGTIALNSVLSVEASLSPFGVRTASGFVTTVGVAPITDTPEPPEVSLLSIGGLLLFLGRKRFGAQAGKPVS